MKCKHCGEEIANDSVFCEFCGTKVNNKTNNEIKESANRVLVLVGAFLSFISPIIGLFLHGINRKKYPADSKKYLWCAIAGFILALLVGFLTIVIDNNSYDNSYNYNYNYNNESIIEPSNNPIYSQSEELYCDGIYENGSGLLINVPDLNKNHFRIQFSFMPLAYKGNLSWTDAQYPLILGHWSRALGICLKSDRHIYITTHNHNNLFDTGIPYSVNEYNDIDLEFNNGEITINGKILQVGNLEISADDFVFTSVCYSTSNAFKGYIKNISIYNLN